MLHNTENQTFAVDVNNLPANWPTDLHDAEFWTALGRTVATFGALEFTLAGAYFALSGTIYYDESGIEEEYEKWIPKLEKSLSDPLVARIRLFGTALRKDPKKCINRPDDLIAALRAAAQLRNVLCHGCWNNKPDKDGKTIPSFYTMNRAEKKLEAFDTPIDIEYLEQTRKHVVELIGAVVTTVTSMGYQFPGSGGRGRPIL